MRVYVAGRMRGVENLNKPAFARAADQLRAQGHDVFNPAAANLDELPLRRIMSHVLVWLAEEADAIALLPGWRKSGGAMIEYKLAKYLGLEIIEL